MLVMKMVVVMLINRPYFVGGNMQFKISRRKIFSKTSRKEHLSLK